MFGKYTKEQLEAAAFASTKVREICFAKKRFLLIFSAMNDCRNVLVSCISLFALGLLLGCDDPKHAGGSSTPTYQFDTMTNVAELVGSLVSPVPSKHPSGETDISLEESMNAGFAHPQVEAARRKLIAMGTAIYPELTKHLHDDRYSYSIVSAAWLNLSVGEAVAEVMAEGIRFSGYGYKGRKNKSGSNGEPDFSEMVENIGWENYARHASTNSKAELQKEFVRWKLQKELDYGFTDPDQEKQITGPYKQWLKSH